MFLQRQEMTSHLRMFLMVRSFRYKSLEYLQALQQQQTLLRYGNSYHNTGKMNVHENSRLDYMAAELDSLKSDVAEVKAIVKDMHTLLSGNPMDRDSSGMIGELRTLKGELYSLKGEIKKYKSYFYALVTLIGLGILKTIIDFLKS